jgi:FMN-dependent NADH-azoreductase
MAKLMYLQASPRVGRSASIAVAEHFLQVYRAKHPSDEVETLNLWEANLPEFDGATIDAKYAVLSGQSQTPAQLDAWKAVARVADHFKAADKYLFSLPMWNFGIP